MKLWAADEVLAAEDLNDNFAELAGRAEDVESDVTALAARVFDLEPSDWMPLDLGAGFSGGQSPAVIRVGPMVYFRGEIWGGALGSTNIVFTLEPGYRPASRYAERIPVWGASTLVGKLTINTNGEAYITESNGGTGSPGLSLQAARFFRAPA